MSRFNANAEEWVKETEERIKRCIVEVCVGNVRENSDIGDVIKIRCYTLKHNRNKSNHKETQGKPRQPAPVTFEQEGKHKCGW